ncbi:MAG: hypothetical protein V3575_02210 [Candidatus Absconditabacteria bacterium]
MNIKTSYTPLYFLSALGFGGLAVSFFMYLMFLTPHKTPVPTFETLVSYFQVGNIFAKVMIVLALVGVIFFAFMHFKYLYHNFVHFNKYKLSPEYKELKTTNNEVLLMSLPTTLGMTINVLFILGALFVPGLWNVVEFLFPLSIFGFVLVGGFGLKILGEFYGRVVVKGDFSHDANNSFTQLMSSFAFAMVGVGLAAPAAMSKLPVVAGVAMIFSIIFLVIAGILLMFNLILSTNSIFKNGFSLQGGASVWIVIPIMTLIGIALVRLMHTISHTFAGHIPNIFLLVLTSVILSIQLFAGYYGYIILKKLDYFNKFVSGSENNPGAYALICPGVGLFVFGFFFIDKGLIMNGLLDKFSILHFVLIGILMFVQYKAIRTIFLLNKQLLHN